MGLISALIFGLIAGAIAKFLMPGKDPGGCIVTMILGIVGSFVGHFISSILFGTGPSDTTLRPAGLIMSIIGAIVVLIIYRLLAGRRRY